MAKDKMKSAEPGSAASGQAEQSPGGGMSAGGGHPALADLDFVKGLIEAVDSSGIDSLEITRAGTRIKISKTPPSGGAMAQYALPAGLTAVGGIGGANAGSGAPAPAEVPGATGSSPAAPSSGPASSAGTAAAGPSAGATGTESTLVDVKSPMVGTFYRAPAPEAPPYVEVGTRVTKGQTLCILEAMKLMNELESEVEGVVRQVLVENAEPVEYGQVLFRIDPSG